METDPYGKEKWSLYGELEKVMRGFICSSKARSKCIKHLQMMQVTWSLSYELILEVDPYENGSGLASRGFVVSCG
ncbi:hypothetical protein RJT34_24237 [Clitoria ternatea]|uniref:Uncharacterized protein n=1 Tax=Clitoria ternatea TaxID=43366 RepID=A0AAN9IL77_CLITE